MTVLLLGHSDHFSVSLWVSGLIGKGIRFDQQEGLPLGEGTTSVPCFGTPSSARTCLPPDNGAGTLSSLPPWMRSPRCIRRGGGEVPLFPSGRSGLRIACKAYVFLSYCRAKTFLSAIIHRPGILTQHHWPCQCQLESHPREEHSVWSPSLHEQVPNNPDYFPPKAHPHEQEASEEEQHPKTTSLSICPVNAS